jgi:AraC-like DNA-binding protein
LSEIAAALHYADAAVFSRAFRCWSNTSPSEWRAQCDRRVIPGTAEPGAGLAS